jgi:hypothetical protein
MDNDNIRTHVGFAILLILIISLIWFAWDYLATRVNKLATSTIEGFSSPNQPFGNKLLELSVGPTATDNIIELPGKFKITGFKFNKSTTGALTNDNKTYKVYIANDKNDIKVADNRSLILNSIGKPEFDVGTSYYDIGLFENDDGTSKYTGGCLLIEKAGLDYPPIGKVEVYGLAPYALSKADYDKMPLVTAAPLYVEVPTTAGGKPEVLLNCKDPIKTDKDANYKIGWLDITVSYQGNDPATQAFTDIPRAIESFTTVADVDRVVVRYQNTLDGMTNIYAVDGPYQLAFIESKDTDSNSLRIYFDEPIIASRVRLEGICKECTTGFVSKDGTEKIGDSIPIENPPDATSVSTINRTIPIVKAYGTLAVARDVVNFKLQRQKFDQRGIVIEGEKCPNVGEMMNKQLQAQLICESLEYKDRERNKRVAYETDKVYLQKLGDQEREIKGLEATISDLIKRKNIRVANSSGGTNIDELSAILNKAESARKEAESYMANRAASRQGVNVKVNLDPQFTGIASKLASRNNPV